MVLEQPPVATPPVALTTGQTRAILAESGASRRTIGASDLRVFPVALSGNAFGWTADAAQSERVLDVFVAHGGDLLDTADAYAGGRSEIILGNWFRSRGRRDDVVLATKIGTSADHPGLSASAIRAAVDASLRRLRTDRIDVLFLHVDDEEVPFEETLLAVDELIRLGKVRHFGAADHTGDRLIEARIASAQLGVARMVALQHPYSLMARSGFESGLARVAHDLGLGVMPRFPLASGFLTGRYRTRADLDGSQRPEVAGHLTRSGLRVLHALDAVAADHETSPAAIALAWLLSKPGVVAPVVPANDPDQVPELLGAAAVQLSRSQATALDRASS